jgi:hypothetical protein
MDIIKGDPIPPMRFGASFADPYGMKTMPWEHLEIGDSFLIPIEPGISTTRMQPYLRRYAGTLGIVIACRRRTDGLQVWRVDPTDAAEQKARQTPQPVSGEISIIKGSGAR